MSNETYIFLSYFLDGDTPLYGGGKGIGIIPDRQIKVGDSANTKQLYLSNHAGTHIDFPNHFFEDGKKSHEYDASFWLFSKPYVINIDASPGAIIELTEEQLLQIPTETDFLIFKTGFGRYRGQEEYWNNNPGLHPDIAGSLRDRCASLRVIGVDFISITSFKNRHIGRIAHKSFLGASSLLLVEDMKLDEMRSIPSNIYCFPLLISSADGSPVTIIAKQRQ